MANLSPKDVLCCARLESRQVDPIQEYENNRFTNSASYVPLALAVQKFLRDSRLDFPKSMLDVPLRVHAIAEHLALKRVD